MVAQAIAKQLPAQAEFGASRPAGTKLAVDPFLRIVGARDALALGDCAMLHGNRLPATAQVLPNHAWQPFRGAHDAL